MRKISLLFALGIIILETVQGQENPIYVMNDYWAGDFIEHASSAFKSSAVDAYASDLGFSNPAGVTNLNGTNFGLAYSYRSPVAYRISSQTDVNAVPRQYPRSLFISHELKYFVFAVGYNQKYSYEYGSDFEIGTEENPEGTGEFAKWGTNSYIDQISFTFGKTYSSARMPIAINLGFDLKYNMAFEHKYIWNESSKAYSNFLSGSVGLILRYNSNVSVGAYYSPGINHEFENTYNFQFGSAIYYQYHVILPHKLTLGFTQSFEKFTIAGTLQKTSWQNLDCLRDDILDYSLSLSYIISKYIALGIGGSSIHHNGDDQPINCFITPPVKHELFLTFGLEIKPTRNIEIGLFVIALPYKKDEYLDRDHLSISINMGI